MTTRRTLYAVSVLWAGAIANGALSFAGQAILSRSLGPTGYGVFAASLAAVTVFTPIASFNVGAALIEGSKGGLEGCSEWVRKGLLVVVVMSTVCIGSIAVLGFVGDGTLLGYIATVLSPSLLCLSLVELASGYLQVRGLFGRLSFLSSLPGLIRAAAALACLVGSKGVSGAAWAYLSFSIVALAAPATTIVKALRDEGPRSGVPSRRVLGLAWPYVLNNLFFLAFTQIGVIVLAALGRSDEAGFLGVASTITASIYMLPSVLYQRFLRANLYRWAASEPKKLVAAVRRGGVLMLGAGLAVGVLFAMGGKAMTELLFGHAYVRPMLVVSMALGVPARFISSAVLQSIAAAGGSRAVVACQAIAAMITTIGVLMSASPLGAVGAALAGSAGELGLVLASVVVWRRLERRLLAEAAVGTIAA